MPEVPVVNDCSTLYTGDLTVTRICTTAGTPDNVFGDTSLHTYDLGPWLLTLVLVALVLLVIRSLSTHKE